MPFRSVVDPQQIAILTAALEAVCKLEGIGKGTPEHERAGILVMSLFRRGATTAEALAAALEAARKNDR